MLPAAAGIINPATGVMNWDPAFFGNVTITATATGLCGTRVGTMTVTVKQFPSITLSPVDRTICEFGVANFDVTASGEDITYQWYVNGVPVADGGTYFGATASTLQIFAADRSMNGYVYHAVVTGCSTDVTSDDAVLTVNTAPEISQHPADAVICAGANTTMQANAAGTALVWKWYVNKGAGFIAVVPDANFSGETTPTLTITNVTGSDE